MIVCTDDFAVHIKLKKVHLPLCVVLPSPGCKSKTVRVLTDHKPAADFLRNLSLSSNSAFIVTD